MRTITLKSGSDVIPGQDIGPKLRSIIESVRASGVPTEIRIPAGRYLLNPDTIEPRKSLWLHDIKNLTIRGEAGRTELIFSDPRNIGFMYERCDGCTIQDLILECDPMPFSQGDITEVDQAGGSFTLKLHKGYPGFDTEWYQQGTEALTRWGIVFDPKTRNPKHSVGDFVQIDQYLRVSEDTWRMVLRADQATTLQNVVPGDLFVMLARLGGNAIFCHSCQGMKIRHITIYTCGNLNVALCNMKDATIVDNVHIKIRPGTDRLLTSCSDGIHCQSNRVGPVITNCSFEGLADDAVTVYALPYVINEVISSRAVACKLDGTYLQEGDLVQVFNGSEGQLRGVARIVSLSQRAQRLTITFDRPVVGMKAGPDQTSGDIIYNLSGCGAGFVVRNCVMKGHRRYAFLMAATDGLIENCQILDTSGTGMMIQNDNNSYPEGPIPSRITIRNNRFVGTGKNAFYRNQPHCGALTVGAYTGAETAAAKPVSQNIVIEGNSFTDYPGSAISVLAGQHVTIKNNKITTPTTVTPIRKAALIRLDNCQDVKIQNNQMDDMRGSVTAAIELINTARSEVKLDPTNKIKLADGKPTIV